MVCIIHDREEEVACRLVRFTRLKIHLRVGRFTLLSSLCNSKAFLSLGDCEMIRKANTFNAFALSRWL